ncbi:unnamed protein product [Rhodiola kirilowii]
MNFFKAVFSDYPQTSDHLDFHSPITSKQSDSVGDGDGDDHDGDQSDAGDSWSFGGLIKAIASKSESVIETYRKDLEDFGSGLRIETAVISEVASRAVEELPATLEVGAFVAQESLESFGQAIDDFGSKVWEGTAEIIAQGKESILVVDDEESDSCSEHGDSRRLNFNKYNRFEALIRAMQCDENTFRQEPDNKGDYDDWKLGFAVGDKGSEIMDLIGENDAMEGFYKRLVPKELDHETFWCRYYYKLHKLKQVEEARDKLVKRALAGVEDEDLSWDDDDDDYTKENDGRLSDEEINGAEKSMLSNARNENMSTEADDNAGTVREKADECESGRDSDLSVVSTQSSFPAEEDLGWDEIEDIASVDKGGAIACGSSESPFKVDLCKHQSGAEDDEDLSWELGH